MSVRDISTGKTGPSGWRSAPAGVGGSDDLAGACRCTLTALPSPLGDICVLRVAGEIDLATVAMVAATLHDALSVRQDTLVVDLADVTFCGAHGLAVLVESSAVAADRGIRFELSGASAQARRLLALMWPAFPLPDVHPSARLAVLAAMTRQDARRTRNRPPTPVRRRPEPPSPTDQQLTERAMVGDADAYRTLVRRHRTRMYRSALHSLGADAPADDTADHPADEDTADITARLRSALATFAQADPH